MNICQCGAQAGYTHFSNCPFPYYGNGPSRVAEWKLARDNANAKLENDILNWLTIHGVQAVLDFGYDGAANRLMDVFGISREEATYFVEECM